MALTPPPPTVAAPPTAPLRSMSQTAFAAAADAFVAWFAPLRTFMDSFVTWYTGTAKPELEALQTDVATKQGQAATSASNAATSETNAADSLATFQPQFNLFKVQYLGAKAANPTLDNQGNALIAGAWYFNTTNNEIRVFTTLATWQTPAVPPAGYALLANNQFTDQQDWKTGTPIASAATINLNASGGNRVHVTGVTTITAVTLTRGPITVIFDGVLTLTHHATNNCLPGAANITTAASDVAIYEGDGTTVRCVSYTKANGLPVVDTVGVPKNPITVADVLTGTFASSAGTIIRALVIDADRDMLIFGSNDNLHAVVINHTLNTIGSPALIRTSATPQFSAILSAANQVLMMSWVGTAMQANVLTITGNSISVGANATATATAIGNGMGFGSRMLQVGSSYVFAYAPSPAGAAYARAMTIAGTTVTIGAEITLTTAATANMAPILQLIGGAVLVAMVATATFLYAIPITVSAGTTLTQGTIASIACTSATTGFMTHGAFASGRILVGYTDTSQKVTLVSVAGTVATMTAGTALGGGGAQMGGSNYLGKIIGNQLLFCNGSSVNVVTDNAGAIVLGTSIGVASQNYMYFIGNNLWLRRVNTDPSLLKFVISGNNPSLAARYAAPMLSTGAALPLTDVRANTNGFVEYSTAAGAIGTSPLISAAKACVLQGVYNGTVVFGTIGNDDGTSYMVPLIQTVITSNGILMKTADNAGWALDQNSTTSWNFRRVELA